MKHYGDITELSGYELPVVDVITGGSPCQDLSVAGKRAGLEGERSGLFMEQVRIVKEMRERDRATGRPDEYLRPRYMVWENVPGAFSSNKGLDFQAVLTEIIRIAEPDAPDVPVPDKGKWPKSGCIYDDMGTWSVAWRVHDAQFWGVPQRRKRIALVADFGGLSAPEVLFERKGLSRHSDKSQSERKETTGTFGESVEKSGTAISFQERAGKPGGGKGILIQNERTGALSTLNNQSVIGFNRERCGAVTAEDIMPTLQAAAGESGNNKPMIVIEGNGSRNSHRGDGFRESDVMYSLNTVEQHAVAYETPVGGIDQVNAVQCLDVGFFDTHEEKAGTLLARQYKDPPVVCGISDFGEYKECVVPIRSSGGDCGMGSENLVTESYQNVSGPLMASGYDKLGTQEAKNDMFVTQSKSTVRRLTPTECERLQGFPDGWTDIGEWVDSKGKKHKESDSPRYKALGNSIAIPFWFWLLRRISAQYERPATLGSLFDGIGGFPLCWERCNGKGTALWASEIEEFPIAVTKARFPE